MVTQNRKQHKCPSAAEGVNRSRSVQTVEYRTERKKDHFTIHAVRLANLMVSTPTPALEDCVLYDSVHMKLGNRQN